MEGNFVKTTDYTGSTDLISLLTQQLENAKSFVKTHKLGIINSLFDALPDEVLCVILNNIINIDTLEDVLRACLACKRFNRIIVDIIYSKRFEFSHNDNVEYFKELENIDNWMEKIISFNYFSTYRDLSICIVKLMASFTCLYKQNKCIVFCFNHRDETHTYFLSNEIYYYRITHPYVSDSDYSLDSVIDFIDYDLNTYNVINHKDVQIYSSEYSRLTITNSSSILELLCQNNIFTESKEYFNEVSFDNHKFWIPDYYMPNQEINNLIFSSDSPLPMKLLSHFVIRSKIDDTSDYLPNDSNDE